MPRQHGPGGVERPSPRAVTAGLISLLALAATSLVAGPAVAATGEAAPCALPRTEAHHSLGLDQWNGAYPRPDHALDAVMVFLSFPDARPVTTPADLTADYFPATTQFFQRASYGKFTLRPHPQRQWIRMPKPSVWYGIQRDWDDDRRSAYLRDAIDAADPEVDFSKYDIVYLVADPDAPGVDSDATKVVNFDRPLHADGTDIRRVVTVFEQHPRTTTSWPTRPDTSSTCPTSTTGRRTARGTGTPTSATGTSWAASSASPPTSSAGTSGSSAGWTTGRSPASRAAGSSPWSRWRPYPCPVSPSGPGSP